MWIYYIRNITNDKVYVGQCIDDVEYRWREHCNSLRKNNHINRKLQRAWNKYGELLFVFETISNHSSQYELDMAEISNIKLKDSIKHGYNIAEGGQFNKGVTYRKIWNGLMGPDGTIYKKIENIEKFSREHKLNSDKLRQVSRGIRYSYKGWKTLVREPKTTYEDHAFWLGKRQPKSMCEKRSLSLKRAYKEGRISTNRDKTKKMYHGIVSPTGEVYDNVFGLAAFCREHGIVSNGRMSELCSGKISQYKGWTIKL